MQSAGEGDLEEMRNLLRQVAQINVVVRKEMDDDDMGEKLLVRPFSTSLLHAAAEKGRTDVGSLLLQQGADVNVRDMERALHYIMQPAAARMISFRS